MRGVSQDEDDDEWQQIPEEWLREEAESSTPSRTRSSARRGGLRITRPPPSPSDEVDDVAQDEPHTGLSSDDAISDLTELSDDDDQEEPVKDAPVKTEIPDAPSVAAPEEPVEGTSNKLGAPKLEPKEKVNASEDIFALDIPRELPADFVEWETVSFMARMLHCVVRLFVCRFASHSKNGRTSLSGLRKQHITWRRRYSRF